MLSSQADTRPSQRHRIFVVDDHPLVREWLEGIIRCQPDLELCGAAQDAPGALAALSTAKAEVLIADLTLDGDSGMDLIKRVCEKYPAMKVLVLSMHEEASYAEEALRAGARGYVVKAEATAQVVEAIRAVIGGKVYVSRQLMAKIAERFVGGRPGRQGTVPEILSDREFEVFQLLGQGRKTREVAEQIKISMKSVQVYRARIKQKLQLKDANELMREAVRWVEQNKRGPRD